MRTLALQRSEVTREKRWTTDEYLAMTEAGILMEGGRVELVDGKIVEMAGMGTPHYMCSVRCNMMLTDRLKAGDAYVVTQQLPITLSRYSEPEPDLCIVRGTAAEFLARNRKPYADEIALVIEISDTTYDFDSTNKLNIYALARVQEYWIVNLPTETLEQYTQPRTVEKDGLKEGEYARIVRYRSGDTVETLELGSFGVDQVLG